MIRDNQTMFNRLHVLLDGCILLISYFLSWFIRFESGWVPLDETAGRLSFEQYMMYLLYIIPGYLFMYSVFQLYSSKRISKAANEFFNLVKVNFIGFVIFNAALFMVDVPFSRLIIGIFAAVNLLLEMTLRLCVRKFLQFIRKKGYNKKFVLLVGYSRATEEFIDRIHANPEWGYVVRGILDDTTPHGTLYRDIKVLGRIDNLSVILPQSKLDEIAITLALKDYGRLEEIVALCEKSGVHTKFIPDYNSVIPSRPYTEDLMGLPVINIRNVPLTNLVNRFAKRVVDIVGAIVALVLFSPVMLIATIGIKAGGGGPIIFKQHRIGLHNKSFCMYKFRTMVAQKEDDDKGWTVKDDPRVTKLGRILRKTSMDEVPQFYNILKGDMSLVGPRPERPEFVERFKEEIPRYMIKHQVRPGLTGWAQIKGYRGDTSIRKRIDCDLYYIENWTMGLDIRILFLTLIRGFINKNAY